VDANNKDTFRIHLGLFLAELLCIPAFIFELERAIGGNTLSWAYVVEWPLLGGYAVYMWRKLLGEVRREQRGEQRGELPARPAHIQEDDDPQLKAWNEYLATLHTIPQSAAQTDEPENLAD
jgi:heme oxygenase